jgi:hypothetical protein
MFRGCYFYKCYQIQRNATSSSESSDGSAIIIKASEHTQEQNSEERPIDKRRSMFESDRMVRSPRKKHSGVDSDGQVERKHNILDVKTSMLLGISVEEAEQRRLGTSSEETLDKKKGSSKFKSLNKMKTEIFDGLRLGDNNENTIDGNEESTSNRPSIGSRATQKRNAVVQIEQNAIAVNVEQSWAAENTFK